MVWLVACSPMVLETGVQIINWYLMPPNLTFSNIRYGSRVKGSNPRKEVVHLRAFLLPSNTVANFTIYIYIYPLHAF